MQVDAPSQFTRHEILVGALRTLAGLMLFVLNAHREAAAMKAQKEELAYQDRPKAGRSCASCRQFSATVAGKGTCAVVEGEVSANGWCAAYSPSGAAPSQNSPAKAEITQVRTHPVRSATNSLAAEIIQPRCGCP
jgi:hypothetical protein